MIEYYTSSTKYSLQERMTRRGKVYDVVFRIVTLDGIEKQKKLSGFATKTLAKQGYTDFITSKCELVKNNPIKKKNNLKSNLLVNDLIRQYLSSIFNQNKDSSIYDKQNIYRLFVLPYFEKTDIKKVSKEMLLEWQDSLWSKQNPKTGEYYSYNYLSKVRAHFSVFLEWCKDRGYCEKNCFDDVKKPKRRSPKRKMQIWTREEFEHFISFVDDPKYHALFTMLFFTGRRKNEILALYKTDIHPDYIAVTKSLTRKTLNDEVYKITSTKADKEQNIPICDIVKKELSQYKGESPFFFGGKKPLSENTVTRVFNRYCEKAGAKKIRMHDLRHSFVSMLIHLGANMMVVADLIGDTVDQVIKTYGHIYETDKKEIIGKIK